MYLSLRFPAASWQAAEEKSSAAGEGFAASGWLLALPVLKRNRSAATDDSAPPGSAACSPAGAPCPADRHGNLATHFAPFSVQRSKTNFTSTHDGPEAGLKAVVLKSGQSASRSPWRWALHYLVACTSRTEDLLLL